MKNKRTRIPRKHRKIGLIQAHVINNAKNYIIVTIIFLVRSNTWSIIYQ